MSNQYYISKSNYLKLFLLYFTSGMTLILLIFTIHNYFLIQQNKEKLETNEKNQIFHAKYLVKERLNLMINDVELLASYIKGHKSHSSTTSSTLSTNKRLINFISKLIETRVFYDQIRLLNSNGIEIIRINNEQKKPKVIKKKNLQDKSNRYYFKAIKYTNKDSVYISPLDWNVEDGKLEYPLKATIRIGKPIFKNSQFAGAIVINYNARGLINQLTSKSNSSDEIFLINNSGYSAIYPTNSQTASQYAIPTSQQAQIHATLANTQVMEPKSLFNQEKPKLWQSMINNLSGNIYVKNTLYTYDYINPSLFKQHNIPPWWIVSSTTKIDYSQLWYLIPLYLGISVLAFCSSGLFAYFHLKNKLFQSLHQFAESYRQVLKKIQLAAVTINQDGIIEFCNDFFLSQTGFTKESLVGKPFMKTCIPAKLRHQLQSKINQAFFQQQSFRHYSTLLKRHDDSVKIINWTITYSPAFSHQSHSVTLVGEDITAQVLNEDQLLRLSHIVGQSPFGVLLTNPEGTVVYANNTYLKMIGTTLNNIVNQPAQLFSKELEPTLKDTIFENIQQGLHWAGEINFNITKSDQARWQRLAISAIKEQDQLIYIVVLLQDISEEKRLSKQVQLESQKRQTSEKLAAIGQAATTIAHDLRNPLCSIKMVLQMTQRHYLKQESQHNELFSIALEQISYMEKTLEDLLSFSRPEKLSPEWTPVNQLIENILSCQHKLIKENHITITSNIADNLPHLFVDPTKLRRILQNLLINAIQATYISPISKRIVTIKAAKVFNNSSHLFQLVIENNGETINEEDLDKVFQPFYTTKNKGTGLGLAIVNQLVLQHQGSIVLEPITPIGTRAILSLPIDYTRIHTQPNSDELEPVEAIANANGVKNDTASYCR